MTAATPSAESKILATNLLLTVQSSDNGVTIDIVKFCQDIQAALDCERNKALDEAIAIVDEDDESADVFREAIASLKVNP